MGKQIREEKQVEEEKKPRNQNFSLLHFTSLQVSGIHQL